MAIEDPTFVHLFRNKEEFDRQKSAIEIAVGKTTEEQKYRDEKAKKLGIVGFEKLPLLINYGLDLGNIFPRLDFGTLEILVTFIRGGGGPPVPWPSLNADKPRYYKGFIPTKILDETIELEIFNRHHFGHVALVSNRSDMENLIYGKRGEQGFLIAFWGSRNVFGDIQKKLEQHKISAPRPSKPSCGE